MSVRVAAVLGLAAVAACGPPVATTLVGKRAPALAPELAGHVVVLDFWATWCVPCAAEVPRLERWQAMYGARGLRVIALSSDDRADIARFVTQHGVSYPVASDPDDRTAAAYRVDGVPTLVVIDRHGVVRAIDLGGRDLDAIEAAIIDALRPR